MPSFSNQAPLEIPSSAPALQEYPHRPSHEKSIMSNAFVFTNGVNEETGRGSSPIDNYDSVSKNGSLHSLPNGRTSDSMNSRERAQSRTASPPAVAGGAMRRSESGRSSPGPASGKSRSSMGERTATGSPQVNGGPVQLPRPKSPSKRTVNGDRTSEEQQPIPLTPITTKASFDPSQHGSNPNSGEPLSTTSTQPPNRFSSPPTLPGATNSSSAAMPMASPSHPDRNRLIHRHTLQVPKLTPTRNSRDFSFSNPNTSEDAIGGGRFSPTTERARRASVGLVRRTTRSIHSDLHLEDVPQDDDAARWTEAIRQKRASRRKKKEEEDDERVIVGTKVDQTHVNWVTAYNMLTGIRFTVSRTNAKMDRDLTDADFVARHKFSFDITGNELTPSAKYDFKFKDYAPWVFRRLRAKFKIDPADYLMSLTSKYILSELGSPGKSGSFFYFSRDYKYIIKTIHHAEHKLLRKILKDYYQHIELNPNTLLSQFYGLHRVKIAYGRKIHFVVMNNLFPPHRDIHQMFDLKGSTIGRELKEEDLAKNPRSTLKDLNFLRRNLHLEFGPRKKELLVRQMRRDVELLKKLKIMDYSLLVGVHDLNRGNEDNLRDKTLQVFQPGGEQGDETQRNMLMRTPSKLENARKARELRQTLKKEKPIPMDRTVEKMPDEMLDEKNTIFYADDGGYRATHETNSPGEEIYYLGIIDCLTHYGLVKKIEHAWKGMSSNSGQISAVPPKDYGDRFINFMTGITMSREEAVRQASQQQPYITSIDQQVQSPYVHPASSESQRSPVAGPSSMDRGREILESAWEQPHERQSRSPVERTLEKAEKQAAKTERHGAFEDERADRTLRTIRSPSAERTSGSHGATLPVVEEAGEAGSTGGRSHGSNRSAAQLADSNNNEKSQIDGVVGEKELPALPGNRKEETLTPKAATAVLRNLTKSPDPLGVAEHESALAKREGEKEKGGATYPS